MKRLLWIARILVGVLFIFSGLIKANDPLGLSYKMQEFFEVWGWTFLNDYTLAFSVLMIAFEIIAGVAVLVGWQMNLFSWLLLLLILFFTFLTGYALFSGQIKECGCFGNVKDLVLLVLICFIFSQRRKITSTLPSKISILTLAVSGIGSFGFMYYTLNYLPVIDCLPYKVGVNILGGMKIPAGAKPDSTVITFVYQHNQQELEFTADQFPSDFNDSTYMFVRRYDKLIRPGNALPAIKDFMLINQRGEPSTERILDAEGYKLFLFIKSDYSKGIWMEKADLLGREAAKRGIARIMVTSIPLEELYKAAPPVFYRFEPYQCDVVAVKTAARTNPCLYLLNKDTILNKWSYQELDQALLRIQNLVKLY
jgi:uncharacterized membrane protein YphA (DoxX/SURF4 family)